MNSEIKVSVCVITYNQDKYIAECLQSLVDQETDFSFEIIVGEDFSTDRTRKIIEEYAVNFPNLIVKNFHGTNVGAVKNLVSTYRMARGKYICHIDGDDYALPGKLQKQCEILEENDGCVICTHDMGLLSEGRKLSRSFKKYNEGIHTINDLYETLPFFAHSSKMFVNDLDDDYWSCLHPQTLDVELHIKQAKKGSIYHLDKCYGMYRQATGVSSERKGVNPILPAGIDRIFEEAILENPEKLPMLKKGYASAYLNYAYQAAVYGDENGFVNYIKKSLGIGFFSKKQAFVSIFLIWPKLFVFLAKLRKFVRYD
jgi:glycosyltransferase involved in cell wall biosynthesis